MSISKMNAIWGKRRKGIYGSCHTKNARLLILALADNSSDDGYCWPSIPELCFKTGMDRRSIMRIIPRLEESGELYVEHKRGRKRSNEYLVTIGMDKDEIIISLQKHFYYSDSEANTIANDIITKLEKRDFVSPLTPESRKGDILSKKVTFCHSKGDIESPEPSYNHHIEPSILTDPDNFMSSNESNPEKELGKSKNEEPVRVDVDDNGDEMPDEWSFENDDLLRYCGNSTKPKRKTFASAKEKRRWQKIRQWTTEDPDAYRWVIDRADRAQKKGWKFPGLLNAIENKVNFEDWKAGSLKEDDQPLSRQNGTEEINWEEHKIEFPKGV